jgi:3-oxoadipate enol-lactonase
MSRRLLFLSEVLLFLESEVKRSYPMPIAKINGLNINYQVEGQGESLVMITGFTANVQTWMFQIPTFKKRFQVITFDNRGSGKSSKPDGPYSVKMMAEDTVALMDILGVEKAHILGFSLGGSIAQEIAINFPERVNKLILVGSWSNKDDISTGMTPELRGVMQLPAQRIPDSVMSLAINHKFYRIIFLPLINMINRRMGAAAYSGILGQRDACLGHNTSDRLNRIKVPTLVMVGTQDRCIKPASSEELAKQIPGAKLLKIDNASHTVFLEMSRRFNREVLSFLR